MSRQLKQQEKSPRADSENIMRQVRVEKVLLSCGATGDNLTKAKKLLDLISQRNAQIIASNKRIPDFGVRPGLEVGTRVTLRGEEAISLLRRLLGAIDNVLKKKQISPNHFSFGIHEYIEIPGIEYQRDIGIRGLNVTIVFSRPGVRIANKKRKSGNLPRRQNVTPQEIIKFMEDNFKTKFK
ncbi:50S ribosomal protein L5 [Candidatus Pacearchaeota archaeon]|nr:50S ribosomal protein L5 [Candidatus Pacearchaeota archaeon]